MVPPTTPTPKHLFDAHPKQQDFINAVARPDLTYIAYGGSAGGGKTFVSLAVLILLCKLYPGSRWAVIRKSLTEIKLNTLPSFWKLAPKSFVETYNKSEFLVMFTNGSQIFFKGENIADDPELQWMDGLEVNGFLLEQVEELNYKTFDKCKLRAGRWVMAENMPPIKILMTLNPSQNWTKKIIYEPYVNGTLKPPYIYIPAKILDNPSLPKQYVEGLKNLDTLTYRRFVEGDWDAFAVNKPYAYAFDEARHVSPDGVYLEDDVLWQSFDFNIDPLTSLAGQHNEAERIIDIHSEEKLTDGNTSDMCDLIISRYGPRNPIYMVTGDATGRNRNAISGNINHYHIIRHKLGCASGQMKVKKRNASPKNLRVLVNSVLQNYTVRIHPSCVNLIRDLKYVEVDDFGEVKKKDRTKENQRADHLDCFAYLLEAILPNFVKFNISSNDSSDDEISEDVDNS